MMTSGLRPSLPILAFGLTLAGIYAVAVAIVARLGRLDNPDSIAGALTIDLTVIVPLLFYLMVVRPRDWPVTSVLPVFLLSVLVAGRVIPETRQHVLGLVHYGVAVAELLIVVVIARKAYQLRKSYREQASSGMDVYESLRECGREVLGPVVGGVLAYEVAVFYYAVCGWRKPAAPDDRSFTVYRDTSYPAVMIAVLMAGGIELVAVHFLLQLWSVVAAWILTALSIYALIWVIGDFLALRHRPLRIETGRLLVRIGLRWTISIPIDSIRAISDGADSEPMRGRDYLRAVLIGAPIRRIELKEATAAIGFYGITRRVTTVDLWIDDAARFDSAIEAARP